METKVFTDAELTPRPTQYLMNVVDSRVTYGGRIIHDLLGELPYGEDEVDQIPGHNAYEDDATPLGVTAEGHEVWPAVRRMFVYGDDETDYSDEFGFQFQLDNADEPDGPGVLALWDGSDHHLLRVTGGLAAVDELVRRFVAEEATLEQIRGELPSVEG